LREEKKTDRIDDTVQNPHKTSHQSILRFSDLLVGHTSLLYFKCFLRNTPVRIAVRLPLFHKNWIEVSSSSDEFSYHKGPPQP